MKRFILATALLGAATLTYAQVKVTDPWIRGTVPLQEATGAFMQLNSQTDTRLVDANSPVARVEIHEMSMHGDVMRMKQIDGLDLPAGQIVELKPGSYHLMLMGLKQQLKEGDTVPVALVFEGPDGQRESVEINVPVRPLTTSATQMKGHHSPH